MIVEKIPQKGVLQFSDPKSFGIDRLAAYYRNCDFHICEYSLGIKLMWAEIYEYRFSEVCGCLIARDRYDGEIYFDYPVAGEGGDVEGAISAIEEYCLETDTPLRFATLPKQVLGELCARYDAAEVLQGYLTRDYLYDVREITDFSGKKFAGQRNHIRRFYRNHPNAVFRKLTPNDREALERFADRFDRAFNKSAEEAHTERAAAFEMLRHTDEGLFRAGCLVVDGEIVGVAMGEKCGTVLVEHIEKALAGEYEGVYPTLFQAFVQYFGGDCMLVNREDDAADKGLRTSKMQYQPCLLSAKYDLCAKSVLEMLDDVPTLQTERLTLDEIRASDAESYASLCRDDGRNRYWGYDYRADTDGQDVDDLWFCKLAWQDFEERRVLNFAIRLENKLIGEAVLYRFDCKGGAELGVRICEEYSGNGYGREVFSALADWALYSLGVVCLRAKCFRENLPSRHMIEASMRPCGEDERMLYFEKKI